MSRRSGRTKPAKKRKPPAHSKPKGKVQRDLTAFKKRLHDLVNRCEVIYLHDDKPEAGHLIAVPEAMYHVVSTNFNQRLRFESMKTAGELQRAKKRKEERRQDEATDKNPKNG